LRGRRARRIVESSLFADLGQRSIGSTHLAEARSPSTGLRFLRPRAAVEANGGDVGMMSDFGSMSERVEATWRRRRLDFRLRSWVYGRRGCQRRTRLPGCPTSVGRSSVTTKPRWRGTFIGHQTSARRCGLWMAPSKPLATNGSQLWKPLRQTREKGGANVSGRACFATNGSFDPDRSASVRMHRVDSSRRRTQAQAASGGYIAVRARETVASG